MNSPVNRLLVVDYTKDFQQRPPLWWEMQKEREEWAYQRYMMQMENMEKPDNNTLFALPLQMFLRDILTRIRLGAMAGQMDVEDVGQAMSAG